MVNGSPGGCSHPAQFATVAVGRRRSGRVAPGHAPVQPGPLPRPVAAPGHK